MPNNLTTTANTRRQTTIDTIKAENVPLSAVPPSNTPGRRNPPQAIRHRNRDIPHGKPNSLHAGSVGPRTGFHWGCLLRVAFIARGQSVANTVEPLPGRGPAYSHTMPAWLVGLSDFRTQSTRQHACDRKALSKGRDWRARSCRESLLAFRCAMPDRTLPSYGETCH